MLSNGGTRLSPERTRAETDYSRSRQNALVVSMTPAETPDPSLHPPATFRWVVINQWGESFSDVLTTTEPISNDDLTYLALEAAQAKATDEQCAFNPFKVKLLITPEVNPS